MNLLLIFLWLFSAVSAQTPSFTDEVLPNEEFPEGYEVMKFEENLKKLDGSISRTQNEEGVVLNEKLVDFKFEEYYIEFRMKNLNDAMIKKENLLFIQDRLTKSEVQTEDLPKISKLIELIDQKIEQMKKNQENESEQ